MEIAELGDDTHGTDAVSFVVSLICHFRGEGEATEGAGALEERSGRIEHAGGVRFGGNWGS